MSAPTPTDAVGPFPDEVECRVIEYRPGSFAPVVAFPDTHEFAGSAS